MCFSIKILSFFYQKICFLSSLIMLFRIVAHASTHLWLQTIFQGEFNDLSTGNRYFDLKSHAGLNVLSCDVTVCTVGALLLFL